MKRILESSRLLVMIPVIVCLISALAVYLFGLVRE